MQVSKIWANSGDSHVLEPDDLWSNALPLDLASRMPWTERRDHSEVVHVDGQSFERRLPTTVRNGTYEYQGKQQELDGQTMLELSRNAPGARDISARIADLDQEGIWCEVVYPSVGLWNGLIKDPHLYREGVRAMNDWLKSAVMDVTDRVIPAAEVSVLSVDDAVGETERVADMGFKLISLPTSLDDDARNWNDDCWEPLWEAAERAGLVIGFHIGSEAKAPTEMRGPTFRGPGGAVANYVETTFGGQRAAVMMVSSGALDRHPGLRILISEGGATWVPFIADRMDEGYRQHGMFVRPVLSRPPSEILYDQVYASFQHDKSAVLAYSAMGYKNIMWGSDYPHMEGTYGHTQETLHQLFDGVEADAMFRMTQGAFYELFPSAPRLDESQLIGST
jgi:predicted TIM-barrel fold metal-dependent hydrolase